MSNDDKEKRILFAGGGTAGHLMPAINIAREMMRIDSKIKPLFIGKKNGMEKNIVNNFMFDIEEIDVIGMKRSLPGMLRFILKWRSGYNQARAILIRFNPDAVIGTGGYISAPIVKAANKMGKPIFLQEQNSLPGLASRSLGRYAQLIFTAYESAHKYFDSDKCLLTGNPIRTDILNADPEKSYKEFDLNKSKKTLCVLGGSSGAKGINSAVLRLIKKQSLPEDWQIIWQTGAAEFDFIKLEISGIKFNGIIRKFIYEMPAAYKIADLVISRAGAMALSEITAAGLPSVLIPYPHATGDHQTLNAKSLVEINAAIVIQEKDIDERFVKVMADLFKDKNKLTEMAKKSKSLGKPMAAEIIATAILERLK